MKSLGDSLETGVVAVLLLLGTFVLLPIVAGKTHCTQTNACIANLKQIEGAIEQYALENRLFATNRVTFADISGGTNKMILHFINVGLTCPVGGTYSITTVGESPRCSVPGHSIDPPPE